eukprot:1011372-Pelagomonas_calceolata.AAC.2
MAQGLTAWCARSYGAGAYCMDTERQVQIRQSDIKSGIKSSSCKDFSGHTNNEGMGYTDALENNSEVPGRQMRWGAASAKDRQGPWEMPLCIFKIPVVVEAWRFLHLDR